MDGRGRRRATRARIPEPPPPLPRLLQSALLVRGGRVPLRRRRREGGRRSVVPAEPGARDLVAASRARCRALEAGARGGCRSLADTGGATVTGRPGNRTISRATMATDAPATPPIIKAPCGRG